MPFVDFRFYEVVLLFRQQSSVDAVDNFFAPLFSSLLEDKQRIHLMYSEFWGKRKLAYPIKKNRFAYMYFLRIKSTPFALAEFKKSLKISEDLIRFFICLFQDEQNLSSQSYMIKSLASDIASSVTSISDQYASVILNK